MCDVGKPLTSPLRAALTSFGVCAEAVIAPLVNHNVIVVTAVRFGSHQTELLTL